MLCCAVWRVNEHFCQDWGKICLTLFWHMWIDDTAERREWRKKSIDLFSIELDEASTRHIECVFCLLSLFLKSQYWSKDYWLGVNCALLFLFISFMVLLTLSRHMLARRKFICSQIHWDWNMPPIKSQNPTTGLFTLSLSPSSFALKHKNTWKIIILPRSEN